jgi:hypothetical protein
VACLFFLVGKIAGARRWAGLQENRSQPGGLGSGVIAGSVGLADKLGRMPEQIA